MNDHDCTRRRVLGALGTAGITSLAGCSAGDGVDSDTGADASLESTRVVAASSSEGTMSHTTFQAFSQTLTRADSPVSMQILPTGGVDEAIYVLGEDDAEFATTNRSLLIGATEDVEVAVDFSERPVAHKPQHTVAWGDLNFYYVTYEGSGIEDLSEDSLAGATVGTGPAGATRTALDPLLSAGVDRDVFDEENIGFTQAPAGLRSGRIDLIINWTVSGLSVPSWQQQLVADDGIRIVPYTDAQIETVADTQPFLVVENDAADFYEDPETVGEFLDGTTFRTGGLTYYMATTGQVSPDVVYEITNTLLERHETVQEFSAGLEIFTPTYSIDRLEPTAPVHPGAVRAYQDRGVWDDTLTVGEAE